LGLLLPAEGRKIEALLFGLKITTPGYATCAVLEATL